MSDFFKVIENQYTLHHVVHPTVYKKTHYLTFDLDIEVNVTRNMVQFPLHHVTYAPTNIKTCFVQQLKMRCIYKKMHVLTFDLGSRSHVAQYALLHMNCLPAKL